MVVGDMLDRCDISVLVLDQAGGKTFSEERAKRVGAGSTWYGEDQVGAAGILLKPVDTVRIVELINVFATLKIPGYLIVWLILSIMPTAQSGGVFGIEGELRRIVVDSHDV